MAFKERQIWLILIIIVCILVSEWLRAWDPATFHRQVGSPHELGLITTKQNCDEIYFAGRVSY